MCIRDSVIGGHIASKEDLDNIIDADYICRGVGIKWFRQFLGEDINAPVKHPAIVSGFGTRIMGTQISSKNTAGVLIPSVGCPMGCNFCSTSALFGGKGNSVSFFETGDELFTVLCQLEEKLGVGSFFVLDENFLLYKKRALKLLELMEENDKSWEFYVFSSAGVLESYTMGQLISLGISWVWMGLEGENSNYNKLNGVNTQELIQKFQSNGIRVLGSTIIGMEEHTPEIIDEVIDYAVSHDTDFHQFMLYTPLPGTPLYKEHMNRNNILPEEECPPADVHGQERFNFIHKHIPAGKEKEYLLKAFREDFEINGPSIARITRTTLQGWKKYRNHPDKRVSKRFKKNSARGLSTGYAGAIWAMTRIYKEDEILNKKMKGLLSDLYNTFGLLSRIVAPVVGRFVLHSIKKEEKRLSQGWTYEPPMIYEKNKRALDIEKIKSTSKISIPQIQMPAYDLSLVLNRCSEQMNDIKNQLLSGKEQAHEQMSQLYNQLIEKAEQSQVRELLHQTSENAAEQINLINENLIEKYENAQKQLLEIRDSMARKYDMSKDHIDQIYEIITEKCEQNREQFETSCEQIRKNINEFIALYSPLNEH